MPAIISNTVWQGRTVLNGAHHRDAEALRALIAMVGMLGASVMMWNPVARLPRLDPTGAILGRADVHIHSAASTSRGSRLSGLPDLCQS